VQLSKKGIILAEFQLLLS